MRFRNPLAASIVALLLAAPSIARAQSCADDASGKHDFLADLTDDLFWAGAHVLQAVQPMAPYPRNPVDYQKERKRIDAQVERKMKNASPRDHEIVADLRSLGVSTVDLFHGSHVILRGDGGSHYDAWRAMGARPRTSSHYPGVPVQQYEIDTPVGILLFGKTAAQNGDTWFQLEKHPDGPDLKNWILHRLDYVRHKGFGDQNVGPMGMSPYTDKRGNPVVVDWDVR